MISPSLWWHYRSHILTPCPYVVHMECLLQSNSTGELLVLIQEMTSPSTIKLASMKHISTRPILQWLIFVFPKGKSAHERDGCSHQPPLTILPGYCKTGMKATSLLSRLMVFMMASDHCSSSRSWLVHASSKMHPVRWTHLSNYMYHRNNFNTFFWSSSLTASGKNNAPFLPLPSSHYHHCANLSEGIELIKCLSEIFCRVCE